MGILVIMVRYRSGSVAGKTVVPVNDNDDTIQDNELWGERMFQRGDLVVYNQDRQITLIVEIKTRTDTSSMWATHMRRNMLAHGVIPNSPFLLIVLPDRLYLWKDSGNLPELVAPTYEMDAASFFQPYFEKSTLKPESISERSFELIVVSWLNELIQSSLSPEVPDAQWKTLEESGLLEALRGGYIIVEQLI